MTPRTILILALGALVCVIAALTEPGKPVSISAASRKDADAIGHVETERDVSILRGGSSHGSNGYGESQGTLVAPTQAGLAPGPLNLSEAMQLANAHRTNRVMPGVRVSVNTNRFPLEDAP